MLPSSWDIYGPRWLRLNVGMTELTRRLLNNEHPAPLYALILVAAEIFVASSSLVWIYRLRAFN